MTERQIAVECAEMLTALIPKAPYRVDFKNPRHVMEACIAIVLASTILHITVEYAEHDPNLAVLLLSIANHAVELSHLIAANTEMQAPYYSSVELLIGHPES